MYLDDLSNESDVLSNESMQHGRVDTRGRGIRHGERVGREVGKDKCEGKCGVRGVVCHHLGTLSLVALFGCD